MKKETKTKKVKVTVLQSDIDRGRRDDPCGCMIYRACKRAGIKRIEVQKLFTGRPAYLMQYSGEVPRRIRLPKKAQTAELRFEKGESVKPFSFSVEVPVD